MRATVSFIILALALAAFLNFWNANRTVQQTKHLSELEKTLAAEKNINTELKVELDDLRSGENIASLVRVELSNFVPSEDRGKIIYVQEPAEAEPKGDYCIVDLISSKAEAKEVQVLLD